MLSRSSEASRDGVGCLKAYIHCEPRIPWQGPFAQKMASGLQAIGIRAEITSSRQRVGDVSILLGTTCWAAIEAPPYLLVDRCSFGDTNKWVSLVWDGHGRRGDHRVPKNVTSERWERIGPDLKPWRSGTKVILCGQTETYSPDWDRLEDWYASINATHFRKHPRGENPTGLPQWNSWDDVGLCHVLNSSVGCEAVVNGVVTRSHDAGAMCGFNGCRDKWAHWLAWTQWSHDEIAEGHPIAHLFQ